MHDWIDAAIPLSDDASFVVAGSRQAGLLCRLERGDPCYGGEREVAIVAQPVRFNSSGHATETGVPPLDMRVGIDCGYFYYAAGGLVEPAACDIPGLAELQAALNGQVLDALAQRWLAERGKACRAGFRRPDIDDLDWQPGQPLSWSDAFEELREENLHGSLGCYAVFDLYFIEPDSDAPEVILHFGEGPHGPTKEAGGIRVNLETSDIEFMPNRGRAKLLRKLLDQYRQRYPDFSHLQARWSQMREFGIEFCGNRS